VAQNGASCVPRTQMLVFGFLEVGEFFLLQDGRTVGRVECFCYVKLVC
jgi:hypothetical protein